MLVHAHPDDETINNGATMAKYVSEGAAVCLVTCTLGEEGEVLVEDLAHLAPDQNDDLGDHRLGERRAGPRHCSGCAPRRNLLDHRLARGRQRAGAGNPRSATTGRGYL